MGQAGTHGQLTCLLSLYVFLSSTSYNTLLNHFSYHIVVLNKSSRGAANYINKEEGLDWINNGLDGDTTEDSTSSNIHNDLA